MIVISIVFFKIYRIIKECKLDIEKIINKIMQKVELNLEENSESFNENNEEIEDNLIVDTDEITCQKCGNHISLEKFL